MFTSDSQCLKVSYFGRFTCINVQLKPSFFFRFESSNKLTKMSDNTNNVHFPGIRFICSPYLAIKSALASHGPIMTRRWPEMNLTSSK